MKRLTIAVIILLLAAAGTATAGMRSTTLSADPVTTYQDGSAIPAEKLPGLTYRCFVSDAESGPWQSLGQNAGMPSCAGDVNMTRGNTYWFTMDVVLEGETSEKAGPISFFFATLVAIEAPTNLSIGTDNVLRWTRPTSYVDGTPVEAGKVIKYYVRVKDAAGAWQYVDGVDVEEASIPSAWWVSNFNAGSITYPPPGPGDTMAFSVSSDYFSDGDEKDGPFSAELVHTFADVIRAPAHPAGLTIQVN